MSDLLTKDLVTYDPLTEVTRRERRSLLALCVVGIGLVSVPLIPTKFATFGIEFSHVNQRAFLALYAAVVGYFLLAFLVYATTDYVAWRRSRAINYREYLRQDNLARKSLGDELNSQIQKQLVDKDGCPYKGFASYRFAVFAAGLRAAFEFALPVVVALFTMIALIKYVPAT